VNERKPRKEMSQKLDMVLLSDVERKDVKWLWNPYIPFGKVTILEGDPSTGKTFVALAVAAAVTQGRTLPFALSQSIREPRNVMFVTGEDDWEDTIRPRFEDAEGDLRRFCALRGVIQTDDKGDVELGVTVDCIPQIDEKMKIAKPALMVIDPFQSFIGANVDFHRANETRPVMAALKNLAEKHECAILLIRHFSKAQQGNEKYRGIGSIDILAAARSVLQVGRNPLPLDGEELFGMDGRSPQAEESRFAIVQVKNNVSQHGLPFGYGIRQNRVVFTGHVDLTAADLDRPTNRPRAKPRVTAMGFLQQYLADGPKPAVDLFNEAGRLGLSEATIRRAADALAIIKKPSGFGKGWTWRLPMSESEPETQVNTLPEATEPERSTTLMQPVAVERDSQSRVEQLPFTEQGTSGDLLTLKQGELHKAEILWRDAKGTQDINEARQAYMRLRAELKELQSAAS